MKITHALALGLLLTACGKDDAAVDSAPSDSGATARQNALAPELFAEPMAPTAHRLAPLPTDPDDGELSLLTISTDSGADGVIDKVQRSYFDRASHRVGLEEDRDGDGVFEFVQSFNHYVDDRNRIVRIETDDDADGTVNGVEVRIWDDVSGRVIRVERDSDGDGVLDRVEVNTWDDKGRKVQWAVDNAPVDGHYDMVQHWDFGPDGRSHARSLERYSADQLQSTTLYTNHFLDDGKLGAVDVDLEGDGRANNRIARDYDEKGRLLASHSDIGLDGSVDTITSYQYDDQGRLAGLTIDTGADGIPDTVISRTYRGFAKNDCFGR